jgi:hypothetical protein
VGAKATLDVIMSSTVADTGKFRNIKVERWENAEGPNQYDGLDAPW